MALGSNVQADVANSNFDTPESVTSGWVTIVDAGGLDDQDASPVTNPDSDITNSTSHILQRDGRGTLLLLRAGYDDALSGATSPVVKVFGRTSGQAWEILRNRNGDITGTLTIDTTNDVEDGTLKYTSVNWSTNAWDCSGCDQILVGIETALAGTGTTSNGVLHAKIV